MARSRTARRFPDQWPIWCFAPLSCRQELVEDRRRRAVDRSRAGANTQRAAEETRLEPAAAAAESRRAEFDCPPLVPPELACRSFRRRRHWAQLERRTWGKDHYSSQVTLQPLDEVRLPNGLHAETRTHSK